MLQVLHREAIAPKHLTNGDGILALLRSLNAVRQRLPTGHHVCGHWIQEHHPVETGVAVHGGESLRHSATARIAMGAHQSGTPTMASQQPMATKPLNRHQAIAELKQDMG